MVQFVLENVIELIQPPENAEEKTEVEKTPEVFKLNDPVNESTTRLANSESLLKEIQKQCKSDKEPTASDLQLALELCDLALVQWRELRRRPGSQSNRSIGEPDLPISVNSIVASLFDDNYQSLLEWLKKRVSRYPQRGDSQLRGGEALLRRWVGVSSGEDKAHVFVSNFFNLHWLRTYVKSACDIPDEDKAAFLWWLPEGSPTDNLLIDQRNLLTIALGAISQDAAKSLMQAAFRTTTPAAPGETKSATSRPTPVRPGVDPLATLVNRFGIKRVITLNYDWEFERLMILPDYAELKGRKFSMLEAANEGEIELEETPSHERNFIRRMPNGGLAKSETYRPRGAANLFEFALNSQEFVTHIVHLHGRADSPENIVASSSDYNRVYRKDDNDPKSLERALDVALSGNPILFVGTKLSEPEITRTFQNLIANGRSGRENPVFALLPAPTEDPLTYSAIKQQVAYLSNFGIYILHFGPSQDPTKRKDIPELGLIGNLKALVLKLIAHDEAKAGLVVDRNFRGALKNRREKIRAKFVTNHRSKSARVIDDIGKSCPTVLDPANPHFHDFQLLKKIHHELVRGNRKHKPWSSRSKLRPRLLVSFRLFLDELYSRVQAHWLDVALNRIAENLQSDIEQVERHPASREKYGAIQAADQPDALVDAQSKRPYRRSHHFLLPNEGEPRATDAENQDGDRRADALARKLRSRLEPTRDLNLLFVDNVGSGKGEVLRKVLDHIYHEQELAYKHHDLLVINFSFLLEIESVIDQIYLFLAIVYPKSGAAHVSRNRKTRLEGITEICDCAYPPKWYVRKKAIIFLTGLDRMFGADLKPLSADFEELMDILVRTRDPRLGLAVVAMTTPTVALWLSSFASTADHDLDRARRDRFVTVDSSLASDTPNETKPVLGIGASIRNLLTALDRDGTSRSRLPTTDATRAGRTRAFEQNLERLVTGWPVYLQIKDSKSPSEAIKYARLDRALMNLLAFTAAPLAPEAALHYTAVSEAVAELPDGTTKTLQNIVDGFKRICRVGLVSEIGIRIGISGSASDSVSNRYAMHRLALKAYRERLGVPSGDVLLSNTFNLSCATSLPVEVVVPQPDIRADLEMLFSGLVDSWKKTPLSPDDQNALDKWRTELLPEAGKDSQQARDLAEQLSRLDRHLKLGRDDIAHSLRVATNILRSFFSAASLVTFQPITDTDPRNSVSNLDEHLIRIQDLLSRLRSIDEKEWLHRLFIRSNKLKATLSVDVSALERQRLEADIDREIQRMKNSFEHGHELRLAPLYGGEIVWLHNERATIALIQGNLYEAAFSIEQASRLNKYYRGEPGHNQTRIDINRSLILIERGRLREGQELLDILLKRQIENKQLNERSIVKPLIQGYMAFIAQLSGRNARALELYKASIQGLEETNQMRALAIFQMRLANLRYKTEGRKVALDEVEKAIWAADASSQLDVLWRARLAKVTFVQNEPESRGIISAALAYAEKAGLHRVTVEAYMAGAHVAMTTSNFEEAENLTAKAMIHANRCRMTLRKISLRITMGKLLLARGDRNGEILLARAISHADRIGFQSAVQPAQDALLRYSSTGSDFTRGAIG